MDARQVRVENQGEVNHMRRCAMVTRWEGNKFGDNARHCISVKRTIDGMCLDSLVAPRFKVTGASPPAGAST